MTKMATFDDWIDLFRRWQKDIGFDSSLVKDYPLEAIYEEPQAGPEVWRILLSSEESVGDDRET